MASQSGTSKAKTKTASQSKQPELDINKLINIAFDLCCKRNNLSVEDWVVILVSLGQGSYNIRTTVSH